MEDGCWDLHLLLHFRQPPAEEVIFCVRHHLTPPADVDRAHAGLGCLKQHCSVTFRDLPWLQLRRAEVDLLSMRVLSFPEEKLRGGGEEPDSGLSWLAASLRSPLTTGCRPLLHDG